MKEKIMKEFEDSFVNDLSVKLISSIKIIIIIFTQLQCLRLIRFEPKKKVFRWKNYL